MGGATAARWISAVPVNNFSAAALLHIKAVNVPAFAGRNFTVTSPLAGVVDAVLSFGHECDPSD